MTGARPHSAILQPHDARSREGASVCALLKHTRTKKNITIAKMHERTGIALHHLRALEECRFDDLPHGAACKTIIKGYGNEIDLDATTVASYQKEICGVAQPPSAPPSHAQFSYFLPATWRTLLFTTCALFVTLYLGFEVHAMIAPPKLQILFPADTIETRNNTIMLRGATAAESTVTVNGVRCAVNRDGSFVETIHLKPGVNEIVVTSSSKRGGQTHISRTVFYTP